MYEMHEFTVLENWEGYCRLCLIDLVGGVLILGHIAVGISYAHYVEELISFNRNVNDPF